MKPLRTRILGLGRQAVRTYRERTQARPPLKEAPLVDGARFLFIGGLHRSGTSIVHRVLREHPATSGFAGTTADEDEGQHLQTVFPAAIRFGGPGRFAFARDAHMTEASPLVSDAGRAQLLREWGAYYDLARPVLLEKSPPNLIRGRFLQAMFPGARFLFIVRHPIAVSCATQKWSRTSLLELFFHWCVCHMRMLEDLPHLQHALVLRYEDIVADPVRHVREICAFAGLEPFTPQETIAGQNDKYWAQWESDGGLSAATLERLIDLPRSPVGRFGYRLTAPFIEPWSPASLG